MTSFLDVEAAAKVQCANCAWKGRGADLRPVIDLEQRIEPGGTVPAGECPECHALAYLVPKFRGKIISVTIHRCTGGPDQDLSHLGEYSDRAETEFAIDREERGDRGRNGHQFFNPGTIETFNEAAPWIPAEEADKRAYWHAAMMKNAEADYRRMEQYNAGDWHMTGTYAVAEVVLANDVIQTLRSPGLWGTESDSEASYFAQIEQEELAELREQLLAVGFSSRQIARAFKTAEHNGS